MGLFRPGSIGLPEVLIVLAIVLLLYGPGRIANIARELGSSITAFREGLEGDRKKKEEENSAGEDQTPPGA